MELLNFSHRGVTAYGEGVEAGVFSFEFRVPGSGFQFRVLGFEFRVPGFEFLVPGSRFRVQDFGFKVVLF